MYTYGSIKVGDTIGKLTAVHDAPSANLSGSVCKRHWYECSCGKCAKLIFDRYVKRREVLSCGLCRIKYTTHKHYKRALKLLDRCNNPMSDNYYLYGARGIKCLLGTTPFEVAENIAKVPGYQIGLTLDRIDNDGNYELGNLRWATSSEQSLNTRRTVTLESLTKKSRNSKDVKRICRTHKWNYDDFIKVKDCRDKNKTNLFFFIHKSLNNFNDYAHSSSKASSEEETPLPLDGKGLK